MINLIFCGARDYTDEGLVLLTIRYLLDRLGPFVVSTGEATGAERLSWRSAELLGLAVRPYAVDLERSNRTAGHLRVKAALDAKETYIDGVVIFYTGDDRLLVGVKDIVDHVRKKKIPILLVSESAIFNAETFIKEIRVRGIQEDLF